MPKKHIASGVILVVSVFTLNLLVGLLMPQNVSAWCDNKDINYDHTCVSDNYDNLPQPTKNAMSRDQYVDLIKTCMDGNASGFDLGIRRGGCADATKSCLENAVDPGMVCNPDVLADMVGGFGNGNRCNDGKLVGSEFKTIYCKPLRDANNAALDGKRKEVERMAAENCVINGTSEVEKTKAREACIKAISDANCKKPALDDSGRVKNQDEYNLYTLCLQDAYYKKVSGPEECIMRGGIYMNEETTGPGGENVVDAGCYKQATDLINENACKAAGQGFQWKKTGNNPDGTPVWTCVDPENPNGEGSDFNGSKDPDAECIVDRFGNCINGNMFGETGSGCGDAKTNIIDCEGEGAAALGDVLRIFVVILSVSVGIAAVGGLAWASVKYAKAEDNASEVSEARTLIRNIVIGILLYGFLLAIVNWLVPGGVISTDDSANSSQSQNSTR